MPLLATARLNRPVMLMSVPVQDLFYNAVRLTALAMSDFRRSPSSQLAMFLDWTRGSKRFQLQCITQ